jgi:hypothetical protein
MRGERLLGARSTLVVYARLEDSTPHVTGGMPCLLVRSSDGGVIQLTYEELRDLAAQGHPVYAHVMDGHLLKVASDDPLADQELLGKLMSIGPRKPVDSCTTASARRPGAPDR